MNPESYFMLGNILFIIASVPNIIKAYKDRNILKGFSFTGASLQSIGIIAMVSGYLCMNSHINVLLVIPNFTYWGLIVFYNFPRGTHDPKRYKKI